MGKIASYNRVLYLKGMEEYITAAQGDLTKITPAGLCYLNVLSHFLEFAPSSDNQPARARAVGEIVALLNTSNIFNRASIVVLGLVLSGGVKLVPLLSKLRQVLAEMVERDQIFNDRVGLKDMHSSMLAILNKDAVSEFNATLTYTVNYYGEPVFTTSDHHMAHGMFLAWTEYMYPEFAQDSDDEGIDNDDEVYHGEEMEEGDEVSEDQEVAEDEIETSTREEDELELLLDAVEELEIVDSKTREQGEDIVLDRVNGIILTMSLNSQLLECEHDIAISSRPYLPLYSGEKLRHITTILRDMYTSGSVICNYILADNSPYLKGYATMLEWLTNVHYNLTVDYPAELWRLIDLHHSPRWVLPQLQLPAQEGGEELSATHAEDQPQEPLPEDILGQEKYGSSGGSILDF